jgi:hypothetical protein
VAGGRSDREPHGLAVSKGAAVMAVNGGLALPVDYQEMTSRVCTLSMVAPPGIWSSVVLAGQAVMTGGVIRSASHWRICWHRRSASSGPAGPWPIAPSSHRGRVPSAGSRRRWVK